MRHTIAPLVAVVLLAAAGAAHAAGYVVEDARERPARAESRNTGAGAELVLSERRVSPRLVERLKQRLAEVAVPSGADPAVKVTRAEVVLFIEGAFAVPGVVSNTGYVRDAANRQWPDELTEVRQSGSSGRREYRVAFDLEVGGRTINARGSEAFIGPENRARLDKAIAAALDDAVKQIGG
jgi:hypothetical protein